MKIKPKYSMKYIDSDRTIEIPNRFFYPTDAVICPHCGEEMHSKPNLELICTCPTHIWIPPGRHIHHSCPLHGEIKISGGGAIW